MAVHKEGNPDFLDNLETKTHFYLEIAPSIKIKPYLTQLHEVHKEVCENIT